MAVTSTFYLMGNQVLFDSDGTGPNPGQLVAALWTNPGSVNTWNFSFY